MLSNKKKETTTAPAGSINVIGSDTVIEGDVTSSGDVRVDGTLVGSVNTASKLVLGISGKIEGNVKAKSADISGKVSGNVEISEILYLKSTSRIVGDILTNKLVVESGGEFNGKCQMGKSAIPIDAAKQTKDAVGQ